MMFGDSNVSCASSQGRLFSPFHTSPLGLSHSARPCFSLYQGLTSSLLTHYPWPALAVISAHSFHLISPWFLWHLSSPTGPCAQARGITDPAFLPLEQPVGGGGEEGFELNTSWKVART